MDGVIINSEPVFKNAIIQMMKEKYGIILNSSIIKQTRGLRDLELFELFIKTFNLKENFNTFIDNKNKYFFNAAQESDFVFVNAHNIINKLSEKYTLALATSAQEEKFKFESQYFDINKFKVVITGKDVKKGKPNPEIYSLAIEKLNIKSNECIVIEDALKGVISAKNAGIKCIAVETSFSKNELKKAGADLTIKDISKLNKKLIDSLSKK